MIRSLQITNFRAFKTARLPLSKLNIILGANSAGKSSLVSALQILKQTNEDPSYGVQIPVLRLVGSQVDAGTFRDIVHSHNSRHRIGFKFSIEPQPTLVGPPIINLDLPSANISEYRFFRYRPYHHIWSGTARALGFEYSSTGQLGPSLSNLEFQTTKQRSIWFTRTRERERIQHWRSYAEGVPGGRFNLSFSNRSPLLPSIARRREHLSDNRKTVIALNRIERDAASAQGEINHFLRSLRFIGPFRTPPKRRYSFSGLAATETGQSGEQAVDLLLIEALTAPPTKRPLNDSVQVWMKHLGLAKSLHVDPIGLGSNMFELNIGMPGAARQVNIADVGFGVSQVLPVIVQGLLVPRGGTYVVQQPELHLHPDAQAALADYFLFLSTQGIRCIVETHSEYFLVRLRRRLAEGTLPISLSGYYESIKKQTKSAYWNADFGNEISPKDVSITCIGQQKNVSQTNAVEITESFQLHNLPADFMGQSLIDRMAIVEALKDR